MIPIVPYLRRRKRRREAREAFTNSPSNAVATPRPAPRDDERNVPVRNVEQCDAQDANCSALETKDAENLDENWVWQVVTTCYH